MFRASIILSFAALLLAACANQSRSVAPSDSAEARAIDFLQREVPAWSRDNGCFSCHNNGDAARALFSASYWGYAIPRRALTDTIKWVGAPSKWSDNQGDPGFSDQRLADIQFAASLAASLESRNAKNRSALEVAATRLVNSQAADGSWPVDSVNPVGSPATYGVSLATYMAWVSLMQSSSSASALAREKAGQWLAVITPDSVPNAAVKLLFLESRRHGPNAPLVYSIKNPPPPRAPGYTQSLDFLRRVQTQDGGWGPYADSPSEVFDTALALLALSPYRDEQAVDEMVQRGREYLAATQLADGSWAATTRPSGGHSYAQQMSTTGWATLALLETGLPVWHLSKTLHREADLQRLAPTKN